MNVKFLDAISTLFTLQRWNFVPRVETWVEAENVAYISHLIYVVGRASGLRAEQIEKALVRALLNSFKKHILSDISHYTRKAINNVENGLWEKIEKDAAEKTVALFPDEVHDYIQQNLITPLSDPEDRESEEAKLLRFVQMTVARSECETNKTAYPYNPYYVDLLDQLDGGVQCLRDVDNIRGSFSQLHKYGEYIKNMKYLRRWNRLNRSVETSVMSHTFVVASLALVTARIEISDCESKLPVDLTYRAILRALFHDVPETFTGDVITPVKKRITELAGTDWRDIEQRRLEPLIEAAPPEVRRDIDELNLLSDLPNNDDDVVGKLVKECDQLASLLECVFERSAGRTYGEMDEAYDAYAKTLLSSSWRSIRQIALYGLFRRGEEKPEEKWKRGRFSK